MNSVLMDVDAKLGWLGKQAGVRRRLGTLDPSMCWLFAAL